MKVAFRADASLKIGTGHVMRCLTLADELTARGAECQFICREHEGNLMDVINARGFLAHKLTTTSTASTQSASFGQDNSVADQDHNDWLNGTQTQDASDCARILAAHCPDWLIVDHYALDAKWEHLLVFPERKLMVIDDLADRSHTCDLLLDQNFGRKDSDYENLIIGNCHIMSGSQFALLRPEFAELRSYSLNRRLEPNLSKILITMGGVDKDNATEKILKALKNCSLPADCEITVVMGKNAPWLDHVQKYAKEMHFKTEVLVAVSNMAQLMADSDLAIGAAGATTWERCCLALPTAMVLLAENQHFAADQLEKVGAVKILNIDSTLTEQINNIILKMRESKDLLKTLSNRSTSITDGNGCKHVAEYLFRTTSHSKIL